MGISFPSIRLSFSFEGVDPHAPLRGPSRTVCSRSADRPAWILISSLPQTPNVAARMKRSPLPTSAGAHADSSVLVRDFSVGLCSSTVDGGVLYRASGPKSTWTRHGASPSGSRLEGVLYHVTTY